ncbi:hypothetical protein SCORR_v1c08020 [Spiroplasma corruscae]|uniref:Uncharacterized protein n=1 Tax=Spiroplasma corruscae TaxID=216934 RepID=A0A222EQQ7_9MOLU|nr:hypothetical protein [Spiroplasma corruscae]ASP28574.1 hypothetical protein SCORR_v1c08020 [Spiroplasma corruscae]
MANQSRMTRNKELHDKVKKDIIYNKQLQNDKSIINSTFERLKEIDLNFFKEKLDYFDKKHQFEKPYLDKDKTSNFISDEIKYDLKREIAELKKINDNNISKSEVPLNKNKDEQKIILRNEKYKLYYENIGRNQQIFQRSIEKLKNKQLNKTQLPNNISMTTVHQMRSQDKRSTNTMLVEVQGKVEVYQNKLLKAYNPKIKSTKIKWVLPLILLVFFVMILSIVIPIFIDF